MLANLRVYYGKFTRIIKNTRDKKGGRGEGSQEEEPMSPHPLNSPLSTPYPNFLLYGKWWDCGND